MKKVLLLIIIFYFNMNLRNLSIILEKQINEIRIKNKFRYI